MRRIQWVLMTLAVISLCGCARITTRSETAIEPITLGDNFHYDRPEVTIAEALVDDGRSYDPDVAVHDGETWMAWLEFTPGEGDRVWVGQEKPGNYPSKACLTPNAGRYAKPTLTVAATGEQWLSYEAQNANTGRWEVIVQFCNGPKTVHAPMVVSDVDANAINHRTAADASDGVWLVWQADRGGQFDIVCRRVDVTQTVPAPGKAKVLGASGNGDWHPDVAVTPTGDVCVVWDSYYGQSYNVLARWRRNGKWEPACVVADGPAFQARAQVVCDREGRTWVAWEEGGEKWGKPYRSVNKKWTNITDSCGPVHRFRELRVASLGPDGTVRPLAKPLPMPAFDYAKANANAREGVDKLGVYYERAALAVDDRDRLWVAYRHKYLLQPRTPEDTKHHIEEGWRVYARCLTGKRWGELHSFDVLQRDGMQRLSIVSNGSGITAAWDTGRMDRHQDDKPKGIALATITDARGMRPSRPELRPGSARTPTIVMADMIPPVPETIGDKSCLLYYGDLHRHTDLSLCFQYYDGTLDDAYRYAIDPGYLDFLGVTDHRCDLAHGDVLSHVWWRSVKEVTRHRLDDDFFPFFPYSAYERSGSDVTDHNVVSLRDDMLVGLRGPIEDLWAELDPETTMTIPHVPFNLIGCFSERNDALRPLLEIYQGCRDIDAIKEAIIGLHYDHRFGLIASSDHMSTGASFACVWAEEPTRESIFRAMQARRTFGATDRIRLIFKSGDHWMGEAFESSVSPTFDIAIDGWGPIEFVDVYLDDKKVERIPGKGKTFRHTFAPDLAPGDHYAFVHMKQTDGEQAWSSPIWVKVTGD